MSSLPQRLSLSAQTAELLRDGIRQALWSDKLPGERTLSEKFQISRNTVRAALRQLQEEKLIRPAHGSGNLILKRGRSAQRDKRLSRDVGLLSPEPLEALRPTQTLWIDALRAMLSERGCRLHVFHGRQFFRSDPGVPLKRLTAENPRGCWILTLSNAAIQSWFAKHEPHCVVAGSVHAGLDLPYRDLDHRAMCRHAAGMLLGLGHRKLGLVIAKSNLAGDLESEAGFLEGVSKSSRANAEAIVSRHDASVAGIQQALRRLLDRSAKPTALLVANAYHYLTVVTRLAQLGLRVPHDISVISRDDDAFLSYLAPTPARYATSAHAFARSLLQPVVELTRNSPLSRRGQRLMPDFISGSSISQL